MTSFCTIPRAQRESRENRGSRHEGLREQAWRAERRTRDHWDCIEHFLTLPAPCTYQLFAYVEYEMQNNEIHRDMSHMIIKFHSFIHPIIPYLAAPDAPWVRAFDIIERTLFIHTLVSYQFNTNDASTNNYHLFRNLLQR